MNTNFKQERKINLNKESYTLDFLYTHTLNKFYTKFLTQGGVIYFDKLVFKSKNNKLGSNYSAQKFSGVIIKKVLRYNNINLLVLVPINKHLFLQKIFINSPFIRNIHTKHSSIQNKSLNYYLKFQKITKSV